MADKRLVVKSVTVAVESTTIPDLTAAAELVGAPETAKIATTGGAVYNPDTGLQDTTYQHSVTFIWSEEV